MSAMVVRRRMPAGRRRAWLAAAVTVLLAALFLVAWSTWTQAHLTPRRYVQLPSGATAVQHGVEFRLLALRATTSLRDKYDGPMSSPPGSVWVVADLEATPTTSEQPLCDLLLIDDQRRSWEQPFTTQLPLREQEDCLPDDATTGTPYRIERIYVVPDDAVGRLVGVAVDRFEVGPLSVLTPPA